MKVLIVDDEDGARLLLSSILEPLGWDAVEAENCQAALEIYKAHGNFDLALIDWNTPKMNGLQFLKEVRSLPQQEHDCKMIMTTGRNDMESVREAVENGINEYIMKPFTEDMILDKIRMSGIEVSESA